MSSKYNHSLVNDERVEIEIPKCIENALNCFKPTIIGDVSHLYNIILKNSNQEQVFVDNEDDLRDVLKQYCLYKKLCEKVEEEIKNLNFNSKEKSDNGHKSGASQNEKEPLVIVIPPCIEASLSCFKETPLGDVSHMYNVALVNEACQPIYVDKECDLRNALRHYCLYNKLWQKIDQDMKHMDCDIEVVNNKIRFVERSSEADKFKEFPQYAKLKSDHHRESSSKTASSPHSHQRSSRTSSGRGSMKGSITAKNVAQIESAGPRMSAARIDEKKFQEHMAEHKKQQLEQKKAAAKTDKTDKKLDDIENQVIEKSSETNNVGKKKSSDKNEAEKDNKKKTERAAAGGEDAPKKCVDKTRIWQEDDEQPEVCVQQVAVVEQVERKNVEKQEQTKKPDDSKNKKKKCCVIL